MNMDSNKLLSLSNPSMNANRFEINNNRNNLLKSKKQD
ncbi:hypothetical protein SAMN05192529_1273 [Arachidicoccus rhizosphaerae]|uniref:Uncharacterized protein n=1 Tax=Arachidicoccus rhizosphaerae TaxID=551991 RepID=A0A1H4C362_9BACT|nr:hypothetical protein SAMN05192529_1273 [Arachidicoccus rhizosphaerae]